MGETRNKISFFRSYYEGMKDVDAETFQRMMTALLEYAFYGKEPELSGLEKALFEAWRPNIDRSNALSDGGKKGGESIMEASAKPVPSLPEALPKPSDTEKEKEKEKDKDKDIGEGKKKAKKAPSPDQKFFASSDQGITEAEAEQLNAAFADFAEMRKRIKAPLTPRAETLTVNNLRKLATKGGEFNARLAVSILNQSTQRSWRGLFQLRDDDAQKAPAAHPAQKPNAFHNFDERAYDYGAIMQRARAEQRQQAGDNMATGPPDPAAG